MFLALTRLCIKHPHHRWVYPNLTLIFYFRSNFRTDASVKNPKTPPSSVTNQTHKDSSSINLSAISITVRSNCSNLLDSNNGEKSTNLSLKDYLLRLSSISPEIVRRFWRVPELKPRDVLEILVGFESDSGKSEVEIKKVESLWGIFKWASQQTVEFEHFPMSCKIMATTLVRVGFFRDAECLLLRRGSGEILLDCEAVFGNLIEGCLKEFELDRAVSTYEIMRGLALVPSLSSYQALVMYLIEVNETQLMYRVYVDMIKLGMGRSVPEKGIHENVIRLLCIDGKVQEARYLVKEFLNYGIRPSDLVVYAISFGYCNKKDYDDLLMFFAEVKVAPDAILGNKILFSLCRNYGVDEASMFLQRLEDIGFCPDEIAFGILIGCCCREGKLKNALFCISDILSKGHKPHLYSYNAIISSMFVEGMSMHAREILAEMGEMGVTPNFSTFKVLLAGFCKARQFDEAKAIVCEMVDNDLVKISSLEDPLTKGFILLGLSPSEVNIRRDNDKGFAKTEFYDNLGNGLYLDTNLDEYEKKVTRVLDDAMLPDFNSVIIENLECGDIESTLIMVDEMARWGQEISLTALSSLLSQLCKASFNIETINRHLEAMSKSIYQLDQNTLNILVQKYSKTGFNFRSRTLFDGMVRRGYDIDNGTYSAVLFDSCKRGDPRSFQNFFNLARKSNWSPEEKDRKALLVYLCKNKWFNEALQLFETISTYDIFDTFHTLIKELSCRGFTSDACVLLEEFSKEANIFDHMAYSHLVSGFLWEKNFAEASRIFETMLSRKLFPPLEVSARLISQICRIDFERASELKNIFLIDQPSALLPIHCALINGLCNSGKFEEGVNLFKEVLFNGLVPNSDVFNTLIEGYCGENNSKKVVEILCFTIRKNISFSISSYGNILRMSCKEGKLSHAMRLKELTLRITKFPEIVLYNILIFHISSMKNRLLLNEVIDALRKKGLQLDDISYNFVIRGFLLCNDISSSLHYLTDMLRQDLRPSNRSLRQIIVSLCHSRELELALELSREMELRGWIHCSVIQNNIVEAILSKGKNVHKAVEFLDRIASKNLIHDKIKYDYLIKRFCQHDRVDKAVDLLNIMLRKESNPPDSTSYDYIIQGLCKDYRNLDKALDFHAEMSCRNLKPSMITWDILVCGLSEFNRVEEAEKILKSMIEFGEIPSRVIFNAVIDKYRSNKNVGKTCEIMKLMQEKGYVLDFETHWSLVSNLRDSSKKVGGKGNKGFLSSLLEGFRFSVKQVV